MFSFADASESEAVLEKLAEWPAGALVRKLPRQPGQKEPRYVHLLAGEPSLETLPEPTPVAAPSRVAQLEQDLRQLRVELDELKRRFDELEAQLR
jgi:uncharacterized protein YceH (UPF0502 family)